MVFLRLTVLNQPYLESGEKSLDNWNKPVEHDWAMVVERSRASYLIDVLGMPKVEGSNPGFANFL